MFNAATRVGTCRIREENANRVLTHNSDQTKARAALKSISIESHHRMLFESRRCSIMRAPAIQFNGLDPKAYLWLSIVDTQQNVAMHRVVLMLLVRSINICEERLRHSPNCAVLCVFL